MKISILVRVMAFVTCFTFTSTTLVNSSPVPSQTAVPTIDQSRLSIVHSLHSSVAQDLAPRPLSEVLVNLNNLIDQSNDSVKSIKIAYDLLDKDQAAQSTRTRHLKDIGQDQYDHAYSDVRIENDLLVVDTLAKKEEGEKLRETNSLPSDKKQNRHIINAIIKTNLLMNHLDIRSSDDMTDDVFHEVIAWLTGKKEVLRTYETGKIYGTVKDYGTSSAFDAIRAFVLFDPDYYGTKQTVNTILDTCVFVDLFDECETKREHVKEYAFNAAYQALEAIAHNTNGEAFTDTNMAKCLQLYGTELDAMHDEGYWYSDNTSASIFVIKVLGLAIAAKRGDCEAYIDVIVEALNENNETIVKTALDVLQKIGGSDTVREACERSTV